ncbi:hypothetical protein QVD17_27157 [Tagetes erecta]|uniref:GrpE protein homolog n=1 Tax=Tagetes erecta TaxID=13708 RepID=A0AAD8NRG1_TARER|nr:hypothetical protein QVD17_27157 [Tagetes erecta]
MVVARISSRIVRTVVSGYRSSLILHDASHNHLSLYKFHALSYYSQNKLITGQISLLHNSARNSLAFQRFGISSSASPQFNEKTTSENGGSTTDFDERAQCLEDLTMEDLIKVVIEKEELLKTKQEEIEKLKDKVVRTYAEMENIMDRTKREAETSKKFAIQRFAKNLLEIADILSTVSLSIRERLAEVGTSLDQIPENEDPPEILILLDSLLEGVEMTEKQLSEIFRKHGVEKFDPTNEAFDPYRHHAVSQVPDDTKPPNTVAEVTTMGYMLHDRVLRPAVVSVTIKTGKNNN